jgi:predicted nuclease of predicted toxin-antitoxin system
MRLLADENFPKAIVDWLRDTGHDVLWARTDCAGLKDPGLLNLAEAEARVLVTLDKDFWQIALQRRVPLIHAGVVLFRIHPATADRIEPLVRIFVEADRGWPGHISRVTADGIWMIPSKRR